MDGKKEEIAKLWKTVEEELDLLRNKEEKTSREKSLAFDYFKIWKEENEREVDKLNLLRENMKTEFIKFCKSEISEQEKFFSNVKLFLVAKPECKPLMFLWFGHEPS